MPIMRWWVVERGGRMASTASADSARHTPVLRADAQSDEGLIAGFLIGYRDRTRAAYLADLRDFYAWCMNAGIGLLGVARMSRFMSASLSMPAGAAPPWPSAWPPWLASTATRSKRARFPTSPLPMFVAPR